MKNQNQNNYMYYFDKRAVLMDHDKFDQVFDDQYSNNNSQNFNNKQNMNNSQTNFKKTNVNNFNNSTNTEMLRSNQNFNNSAISNNMNNSMRDSQIKNKNLNETLNNNNQSINVNDQTRTIHVNFTKNEIYETIKSMFLKTKGYIELRDQALFDYFKEYRGFEKKGIKIPDKIAPLLPLPNNVIKKALEDEYNLYLAHRLKENHKQDYTNKKKKTHPPPKFSDDTLKRIYPKFVEDKVANSKDFQSIERIFERLINLYYVKNNKSYKDSNDDVTIVDFLRNLSEEEKNKYHLKIDEGENALVVEIIKFLSEEEIVDRIRNIYKRKNGFECFHPRPIHDYWDKFISEQEKYQKGLNKFDPDTLYQLLDNKFNQNKLKNNEKKIELNKLQEKELEDEKNKYKREKAVYKQILKNFNEKAKPKDRWRTGNVMLRLRKKFNYDNIIKKMIQHEFSTNRIFKLPEEYELYDSDKERKIIFKNSVEKKLSKEDENRIFNNILRTKINDKYELEKEQKILNKLRKEDYAMEKYIKNEIVKYYKRLFVEKEKPSSTKKNKLLRQMYNYLIKKHTNACKRRFPKSPMYGTKVRHKVVSKELASYFNKVFNRLYVDGDGNVFFSKIDNMSFWAPSLSNYCKIHSNNCPQYCINNTQNKVISIQRKANFKMMHDNEVVLLEDERLNPWKRKDKELLEEKQKIFLCFNEAEHCTFEPKLNKNENEIASLTNEEIAKKRISNKAWVEKMGKNYTQRNCLIYKDGICKKAKVMYSAGKFTECINVLKKAFDLDRIKANFDAKFAVIYNKKLLEGKIEKKEFNYERSKEEVPQDSFKDPKNLEICREVYSMIRGIEDFKLDKKKQAKRLIDELALIEKAKHDPTIREKLNNKSFSKSDIFVGKKSKPEIKKVNESNNENVNNDGAQVSNQEENKDSNQAVDNISTASTKNTFSLTLHQTSYINERYFKYFKSIMCPLNKECPYDLRPRWPHSDIKAITPFGLGCHFAHHISELKFEQEIKEKIHLKKQNLKKLLKDDDPILEKDWEPTGPLLSCNGCGKNYAFGKKSGKICNFCRFNQHNDLMTMKEKRLASKSNEKILKNSNFVQQKPEEWDQSFEIKFGILKKASVLYSFRRYIDALNTIEKAKKMVEGEENEKTEKFKELDIAWRKKLNIENVNIPKEVLSYEITELTMKFFKIEGISLSNLLVYCDKMRKGNDFSIYNRHTYLNNQIMLYYDYVKSTIDKYKVECKSITRQLNEYTDFYFNKENQEKMKKDPKPSSQRKYKFLTNKFNNRYKLSMCENIKKTGKCKDSYHNCKFAHHPNILNLVKPNTQIGLLKNNLEITTKKLSESKLLIHFIPPKLDRLEKGKLFIILRTKVY